MADVTLNSTADDKQEESEFQTGMAAVCMVITTVGIVGNIITIAVIKSHNHFHNATYTSVALLAVVDLVALCLRGLFVIFYSFLNIPYEHFKALLIGTYVTFVCSCSHVIILARLRYKLLAFPLEGMSITSRNMICQSVVVWIISTILGVPYGCHLYFNSNPYYTIVETAIGIMLCIYTVVSIIAFHILKVRKLKENVTPRTETIRKMNKFIIAVCILQIVIIIPMTLHQIIKDYVVPDTVYLENFYSYLIPYTLLLLSHSLNPIVFFCFNSCQQIFGKVTNIRAKTINEQQVESCTTKYIEE